MDNGVRLIVNGREVRPEVPPYLRSGAVMVPIRQIAQRLGIRVETAGHGLEARLFRRDVARRVTLQADSEIALVDGVAAPLGTPVQVTGGRLVAPAVTLAAALGVEVHWEAGCRAIVLMRKEERLAGRRVVVDAGHGADDSGVQAKEGFLEKEANLVIAQRLHRLLLLSGIQSRMVRNDDQPLHPLERVRIAEEHDAEAVLSIHHNSSVHTETQGTETYYYQHPAGRSLAYAVHHELVNGLERIDRGIKEANFFLLRQSACPAARVEVAFLTHPEESVVAADPWFRMRVALALYRGLRRFLEQHGRSF